MPQTDQRVLVVDDEDCVRTFVDRVLTREGYAVVTVADGPNALRVLAQKPPFDLYLLDVGLPQMPGDELARHIRRTVPDAKILYFSGNADTLFETRQVLWEHEAFLEKPVTTKALVEAVSLMLTGRIEGPLKTG